MIGVITPPTMEIIYWKYIWYLDGFYNGIFRDIGNVGYKKVLWIYKDGLLL